MAIGLSVATLFGKLFGAAPRGDFQKFGRTIYPIMATRASESGVSVFAFWFGDIVEVRPDASFASIMTAGNLQNAETWWEELAKTTIFEILRCIAEVDWNNPSSVASGCFFDRVGPRDAFDRIDETGSTGIPSSNVVPINQIAPRPNTQDRGTEAPPKEVKPSTFPLWILILLVGGVIVFAAVKR